MKINEYINEQINEHPCLFLFSVQTGSTKQSLIASIETALLVEETKAKINQTKLPTTGLPASSTPWRRAVPAGYT
jgi:hypothetical protein